MTLIAGCESQTEFCTLGKAMDGRVECLLGLLSTPPQVKKFLSQVAVLPLALAAVLLVIALMQAKYLAGMESWVEHSDEVLK